MAESFEERAEKRRKTWRGGVARSFAEMAERDLEFWAAATPAERIRGVTELNQTLAALKGEDGSPPRLQRSLGGVRSRGG